MLQTYYEDSLAAINPNVASAWPSIARAYAGRAYHNLDHLAEMLEHLRACPTSLAPAAAHDAPEQVWTRRAVVDLGTAPLFGLALVYHDLVYVAGRPDNEARSADLLVAALRAAGASPEGSRYCRNLIMATKNHQPANADEALLVDLDLAVLARPAEGYDVYTRAIRQEFSRYPGFLYRRGRKKVLAHFLDREFIYHLPYYRNQWETTARQNLLREINQL